MSTAQDVVWSTWRVLLRTDYLLWQRSTFGWWKNMRSVITTLWNSLVLPNVSAIYLSTAVNTRDTSWTCACAWLPCPMCPSAEIQRLVEAGWCRITAGRDSLVPGHAAWCRGYNGLHAVSWEDSGKHSTEKKTENKPVPGENLDMGASRMLIFQPPDGFSPQNWTLSMVQLKRVVWSSPERPGTSTVLVPDGDSNKSWTLPRPLL